MPRANRCAARRGLAARLAAWAACNLIDAAGGSRAINPSASSRATVRTIRVELPLPLAGLKPLEVRRAVEGVLQLAGAVALADSVTDAQRVAIIVNDAPATIDTCTSVH